MIAADIGHSNASSLQRSNFGRILTSARDVSCIDCFGDSAFVQLFFGLLSQTLPVCRKVVKEDDLFVPPVIGQVCARHATLHVVATDNAEYVGTPLLCQQWVCRAWRYLKNVCLLVNFRCRNRSPGAIVPDDDHRTVSD